MALLARRHRTLRRQQTVERAEFDRFVQQIELHKELSRHPWHRILVVAFPPEELPTSSPE